MLSSFADMPLQFVLRNTSANAVIKLLTQCNETYSSSYNGPLQESCVADIASDLVSSWCIKNAVMSSCRRLVCVTNPVRRFPETL